MIFRRKKPVELASQPVREGEFYRRTLSGQVLDTVYVVSVEPDVMGIPHVRFWIHHEQIDASDELRTLALSAFAKQFPEPVALPMPA